MLTHWGRVTHKCISKLYHHCSDNGLSPGQCQAIIWTNPGILLIGPLGTNLSEILVGIHIFSFKKMHLKMSSIKWRPFCLGLNVLNDSGWSDFSCQDNSFRAFFFLSLEPWWGCEWGSSCTSRFGGTTRRGDDHWQQPSYGQRQSTHSTVRFGFN